MDFNDPKTREKFLTLAALWAAHAAAFLLVIVTNYR